MTTLSDVTSERVIVTSHFTVALNNTNSSSVSTTASLVFSSSTEHLSLTSTPVTTQGISALYTTQSLTLHSNTPGMSTLKQYFVIWFCSKWSIITMLLCLHIGTLILIQQNMTWVEATAYCREHYIDRSCVHLHSRHSADGGGKGKKGHNTSCLDWPTIHMRLKSLVLDPLSQWVLPELGPWTRHWREIQLWICRCHWGHWEAAVGRPASDWKNKFHLLCMYWLREAINGSYLKNFNTIPWCGDLVWF